MMLPKRERWKVIKDFPDYMISSWGRVKSTKNNKETIMKPYKNNKGYWLIQLRYNNKRYAKLVHRLVAEAFIINPYNKEEVNHKDENKNNNAIWNLEWLNHNENIHYGTGIDRMKTAITGKPNPKRKRGFTDIEKEYLLFPQEYKYAHSKYYYKCRVCGESFLRESVEYNKGRDTCISCAAKHRKE